MRLPSGCSVAAQLRTRDSGVPPGWGLPLPWRDHRGVKNTTCLCYCEDFSTAVPSVKVVQSKYPEGVEAMMALRFSKARGSPFQDGPLFAKAADLGTFSEHRENSELLRKLNKRLKIFMPAW